MQKYKVTFTDPTGKKDFIYVDASSNGDARRQVKAAYGSRTEITGVFLEE